MPAMLIDLPTYHALGFSHFRDPPNQITLLIITHRSKLTSTNHFDKVTLDATNGEWLVTSTYHSLVFGAFNTHQDALAALTSLEMLRS